MKVCIVFLFSLILVLDCQAQEKKQEDSNLEDECIVYFIDNMNKHRPSDDDDKQYGTEVGRFFAGGGEGSLHLRRFRLKKQKLFIFASAFYEDDLWYGGIPHDAVTLKLSITKSGNKDTKDWLAFSGTQFEYRADFGAAHTYLLFRLNKKTSFITMKCQRRKMENPKER